MSVRMFIVAALLAASLVTTACNAQTEQKAQTEPKAFAESQAPAIDHRALDMLKKMSGGGMMKMMKRMGGMKGMPKMPF